MNKNKLHNISRLIERLKVTNGVHLHHLSLLGNPLCPYPIAYESTAGNKHQEGNYFV